MMIIPIAI